MTVVSGSIAAVDMGPTNGALTAWTGGTLCTFLSAVKYNNRTINHGEEAVPNETQ